MGYGAKGSLAGGPSVLSTAAPSSHNRSVDSLGGLSVLSHCSKGPKWGFGGAPRFKWMEDKHNAEKLKKSTSSPALVDGNAAKTKAEIVAQTLTAEPENSEEKPGQSLDANVDAEENEDEAGILPDIATLTPKRKKTQDFKIGCGVPRLEGSKDRFLDPREHAKSPRAKSYGPAQTIAEGTAPCFPHSPKFSFGGGNSRAPDSEPAIQPTVKPRNESNGATAALANRRSKRKVMCRGFGSAPRCQVKGGPMELPISPGPAVYDLTRECDKVPEWSSKSRIPWGHRTGSRSTLINPTASDAGPGEYTADHPFQSSAPPPKILHVFKGIPDSRRDYPAAGTYEVRKDIGADKKFQYSFGTGSRPNMFKGTCSPGHVYDPTLKGVDPEPRSASWGTAERRHISDTVDPDEPPGPGAHTIRREYKATDKPSAGLPRDEKQFRKMGGMGPLGFPGPGDYAIPSDRLGKPVGLHLPLKEYRENYPAGTDYDPSFALTNPTPLEPRPMHRTAPRKSPFDVAESGSSGAAEALLKRALAQVGGDAVKPDKDAMPKFASSTPKWSFSPKRPPKNNVERDHGKTMYGSPSSFG
eukprot:TRINITY_DN27090_c0_g1_i1.p1 TRINITY_DN27090_c0_g1~~TRINITY_DN27090_c0_g1_i1.p1  ORF type:complete len:583 (-),score=71.20 TRINITY_DN27090_c0_g1_i1:113-1861(-)